MIDNKLNCNSYSICNSESNSYNNLINSNPDFKKIISEIKSEQSYSMHEFTHELGNIVTLISSSLQIIESSHPEVKDFKFWNSTIEDVHYLINLTNQLSIYNNGTKLHFESTNIPNLIDGIISSFSAKESLNNITFIVNNDASIPSINADSVKLKQVVINLLKNACEAFDYSELQQNTDLTSTPTIVISSSICANNIIIIISDNGCGIPKENLINIFKPMVSYKSSGTGLGLPISQKIITAHKGSLSVTSEVNKGTTFKIVLPI